MKTRNFTLGSKLNTEVKGGGHKREFLVKCETAIVIVGNLRRMKSALESPDEFRYVFQVSDFSLGDKMI